MEAAGPEVDLPDAFDDSERPARNVARGLLYGCLVGGFTALVMAGGLGAMELGVLGQALAAGQIGEFLAGLVIAVITLLMATLFGLFGAMPVAAPFIFVMAHLEQGRVLFRQPWMWAAIGATFAFPLGLWLAWLDLFYDSDRTGGLDYGPLALVCGCGLIGGLAAWCGYYELIDQIRSRNSSSTAR